MVRPRLGPGLRQQVGPAEGYLGRPFVQTPNPVFVVSEEQVGKGHGGKNEDDEYFDLNANI